MRFGMRAACDAGTASAMGRRAGPANAECNIVLHHMNASRPDSDPGRSGKPTVRTLLEQIVQRLELLERRIERLEARASGLGARPEASNAAAYRAADEPARKAAVSQRPDAGKTGAAARDPVTERLHRVPAADDPFPDLSLLDEKLEPKKGPAERVQVRAALEDLPRICNRIQELWGTPECESYLTSLVIDTRGDRKGFPPGIMEELLYLGRLARALVILAVGGDMWESYDQIGDRR